MYPSISEFSSTAPIAQKPNKANLLQVPEWKNANTLHLKVDLATPKWAIWLHPSNLSSLI